MKKASIIYVNYTPYENTGKILDFLKENFEKVALFSLNFHKLKNAESNNVKIYHKGKLTKTFKLIEIPTPESLVFLLIPLRSLLVLIQVLLFVLVLNSGKTRYSTYFTVNAFPAWVGSVLKKLRLVDETIFWVWDYYPPYHKNRVIRIMRKLYWKFDKLATHSDRVIFMNNKLMDLRAKSGIIPKNKKYPIVQIATDPINKKTKKTNPKLELTLGFIGVLKKSQGLELIYKYDQKLLSIYKRINLEIIGDGPDRKYFEDLAEKSKIKSKFRGFLSEYKVKDENKIIKILSSCHIGLATYIPEKSNVSYFGDPAKIKRYISVGLPVITTDVFEFSNEISKNNAGIIIDYYKKGDFIKAVEKILNNYKAYETNTINLGHKYDYRKNYKSMFGWN